VVHRPYLPLEFADVLDQVPFTSAAGFTVPHVHNFPDVNSKAQLESYPLPRYKTGYLNELSRNVQVFTYNTTRDINTNNAVISDATIADIMLQAAKKWHYYLPVTANFKQGRDNLTLTLINNANANPDLPRSAQTLVAQIGIDPTASSTQYPNPPNVAMIENANIPAANVPISQNPPQLHTWANCIPPTVPDPYYAPNNGTKLRNSWMPNDYYLYALNVFNPDVPTQLIQAGPGHFYMKNNEMKNGNNYNFQNVSNNACLNGVSNKYKTLNPSAPLEAFKNDARLHHYYLDLLTNNSYTPNLNPRTSGGGNAIDLLFENGEVERLIDKNSLRMLYWNAINTKTNYTNLHHTQFQYVNSAIDATLSNTDRLFAYQAKGFLDRFNTYIGYTKGTIPGAPVPAIAELANVKYTLYNMDAQKLFRWDWEVIRKGTSDFKTGFGKYSAGDFYPWLQYWSRNLGAYHGFARVVESTNVELNPPNASAFTNRMPDKLKSPYVCAGWNPDENYTKRPAQWLGLLKALNMMGAEFFYAGHFGSDGAEFRDFNGHVIHHDYTNPNPTTITPIAANAGTNCYTPSSPFSPNCIPKSDNIGNKRNAFLLANYVWQLSTPSYAQATAYHYYPFLLNGTLIQGNKYYQDIPVTLPATPTYSSSANAFLGFYVNNGYNTPVAYTTPAGWLNPETLIAARKMGSKYAITASLQPQEPAFFKINDTTTSQPYFLSYIDQKANIEADIDFALEPNKNLKTKARRQGSTYLYDETNATDPVFYQVDAWHEWKHPLHWDTNFMFEAEVYDYADPGLGIARKTLNAVYTPITNKDFRNFATAIEIPNGNLSSYPNIIDDGGVIANSVNYTFEPRTTNNTYYVFIKARSNTTTTPRILKINIFVGNVFALAMGRTVTMPTTWAWYRLPTTFTNAQKDVLHTLRLGMNKGIQIDKIYLSKQANLPFNDGVPVIN
jgi:hypothetical protein